MLYFSNPLKQSAISSIFLTIMTSALSRLQDRFEVVQYQQTMVIAHILDEQGYLVVYLPWQIEMLLIRDKADTLPQQELYGGGVLEGTPAAILHHPLPLHS